MDELWTIVDACGRLWTVVDDCGRIVCAGMLKRNVDELWTIVDELCVR